MLLPLERLVGTAVMSLQTGAELARVKSIIIDPRDLTIAAYELEGPLLDEHPSYLRPVDVRELSQLGFIVDSNDEFVLASDVIHLEQVLSFNFVLLHLQVIDQKGRKIGKVASYAIDSGSFSVQQLSVRKPLLKSFNEPELLINRSQVVEVNDTAITVVSADITSTSKTPLRDYANPFRSTNVQPEAIDFESRWHSSNQAQ